MIIKKIFCLFSFTCWVQFYTLAQQNPPTNPIEKTNEASWFSLGGRSTASTFNDDGSGIGTGGQFRVQLNNRVNTDWFGDYIVVNSDNKVRSEYYHIGWSVLFYPFEKLHYPEHKLQPYILAGHCFDYNKKTVISNSAITKDRLGSAVQAGIGTHFNLTKRFDISLTTQYMIHLTKNLEVNNSGATVSIIDHKNSAIEGHLLTTISFNYKIVKLWKK